jgi:hypothetical protein
MNHYASLYPALSTVLDHVNASIHAEQVFCSITTEMKFIPSFKDQPPLAVVHRENYETSYHMNTAAGNLHRLLTHGNHSDEMLILMTIECFIEAREHERKAEQALDDLQAPSESDQHWLEAAHKWHRRRRRQLRRAARVLRAAVGPDVWQQGAVLAD